MVYFRSGVGNLMAREGIIAAVRTSDRVNGLSDLHVFVIISQFNSIYYSS